VTGTPRPSSDRPATYADSGVDIDAGERAVDLIRSMVASTHRDEVVGGLGDFGGLFRLDTARHDRPVLVAATDGVGTKLVVAQDMGRLDTIGVDLVAMCVDDLVCQGAEPLFFLDYISAGAVEPAHMAGLVAGVAEGCRQVGAALLGGEMAEHAGIMQPGEFDLVGFAVGVVDQERILGSARVRPGDVLIGLPSPGLRCNGYTLARHVLLERMGLSLDGPAWEGADVTLGEELLRPSVIYTPSVRAAIEAADVHAVAHITGGGYAGNIPRALPEGARAVIERGSWQVPAIFTEIRRLGRVADDEMARVFNLGLGMVLMVGPDSVDAALAALDGAGVDPVVVGRVEPGARGVDLVGPGLWSDPA
jgi:phosphoribosylformylglycinamidine cyclo-ligase